MSATHVPRAGAEAPTAGSPGSASGARRDAVAAEGGSPQAARPAVGRRERRRQETRDEILRAARQILIAQGAEHLTVREIARRTEFTPSALYRYFEGGRQEILLAITRGSVRVLDGYLARTRTPSSPTERIVTMGAAYLRFAREHPEEERLLFDSVTAMQPLDLDRPDEYFLAPQGVLRLLESAVREGIADGTIRVPEKDLMVVIVSTWVFVHGLVAVERLRELHGGVSQERLRGLIRAWVNGLGTEWAGSRATGGAS